MRAAKLILEKMCSDLRTGESSKVDHLRITDLCTGTGCISLLLYALLSPHLQQVSIVGVDINPKAVSLARRNLLHNLRLGSIGKQKSLDVYFREGNVLPPVDGKVPGVKDVLSEIPAFSCQEGVYSDVVIANPPYIAPVSFWDGTTARSVRKFEPSLALVPPEISRSSMIDTTRRDDIFFQYILQLAFDVQAKLTVLECGNLAQAQRVAVMCRNMATLRQQDQVVSVEVWSSEDGSSVDGTGPYAVAMLVGIGS